MKTFVKSLGWCPIGWTRFWALMELIASLRLTEAERCSIRVDALNLVGIGEMKDMVSILFLALGDSRFSTVRFYIFVYLFLKLFILLSL